MNRISLSILVTALPLFAATSANAACYHKPGDWSETLRDTNGGNLLWLHKGKSKEFFLKGIGTGIPDLIACPRGAEDLDSCLGVKFRKSSIIFGSVKYIRGCKK